MSFTQETIVSRLGTMGLFRNTSTTPKIIRVHFVNFCSSVITRSGPVYRKQMQSQGEGKVGELSSTDEVHEGL
jgi:hypothetical protein